MEMKMMGLLEDVRQFAIFWHGEQKRKYTGLPYTTHTEAVGSAVAKRTIKVEVIAAAYLHDVLEDTECTYGEICERFGSRIAFLVQELTDVFTSENYPDWNREKRKKFECERLGQISVEAKLVKRADLEDNTKDILSNDAEFAKTYLIEKLAIMEVIGGN